MSRLFTPRTRTDWIVCHCSATPPEMDIGAADIRRWHREKGWSDIGYAFVIRRDGRIEDGRPHDVIGAHVEGHNATSVGFCLVGGVDDSGKPEANFTSAQYVAMAELLNRLTKLYPSAGFRGHRDFPGVKKACPSFDFPKWIKDDYLAAIEDLTDARTVEVSKALPTIYAMARHFGYSVAAILKENPGLDPKKLQIGQLVKLPD